MDQEMDLILQAMENYKMKHQKFDEANTFLECGLINGKYYKVEKGQIQKIQKIVDKVERYDDVSEFINDSIDKIADFWSHPENMMDNAKGMWPDFTPEMKEEIKKNALPFYQQMEQLTAVHNKLATIKKEIVDAKTILSKENFSVPENIVIGDAYSLMHQSYNRFFPLKILVTTLGLMIAKRQHDNIDATRWIGYEEFCKEAYDVSLELSKKLKAIKGKEQSDDKRNKRISTGLPISHPIVYGKEPEANEKDEKSKQRFLECFIGPRETSLLRSIDDAKKEGNKKLVLSGALNETGLVHLQNNNGKLEITLSKDGFKFFDFPNPVINGMKIIDDSTGEIEFNKNDSDLIDKKIFSREESRFIQKTIIPRFRLEKKIIDDILDKIKDQKSGEINTEVLDGEKGVIAISIKKWIKDNQPKAEEEKIEPENLEDFEKKIKTYRMATMGRLAEIGVVNWDIKTVNDTAKSFYSISKSV